MKDVELDADERTVIDAARPQHEPTAMDRARVRRSLEWKLAAGAALAVAQISPGLAAAIKTTLVIVATGAVVGSGAYVVHRRYHPTAGTQVVLAARPAPSEVAARSVVRDEPPLPAEPIQPAPEVVPPTSPARPIAAPARRREAPIAVESRPDLGAETALLAKVNAVLSRGQAAQALALLGDYDRMFRSGQLRAGQLIEERAALGVLALCASGQVEAARTAHSRYLERWPHSPLEVRLKKSCVDHASSE
jgi:hypothetical protein